MGKRLVGKRKIFMVHEVETGTVTPCKNIFSVAELLFPAMFKIKLTSVVKQIKRTGMYNFDGKFIITRAKLF